MARPRDRTAPDQRLIDRFYFRSIYFREPSGILFELATMGPGFTVDEDAATLGEKVALPPFLEPMRERIEAALTPLDGVGRQRTEAANRPAALGLGAGALDRVLRVLEGAVGVGEALLRVGERVLGLLEARRSASTSSCGLVGRRRRRRCARGRRPARARRG